METVKLLFDEFNEIIPGPVTRGFISSITPKLSDQEELNLKNETINILSNCCPPNSNKSFRNTGLVYGYVQSGKTMSFTTLCALAKDNSYRIVILFTGIKTNLLKQTNGRLMDDLKVYDGENFKLITNPSIEKDHANEIKGALKLSDKPLIVITIMKNAKGLENLIKVFNDEGLSKDINNHGVLVIDDEADQASLNTKAKQNSNNPDWVNPDFSSTYANISEFRATLNNHTYLQYTATPQGLLAIAQLDELSPDFHVVLTPGEQYIGGKVFFETNKKELLAKIPEEEVFHPKENILSKIPSSLEKALDYYLIGASIEVKILKNINQASMMVHCHQFNDPNERFYKWIINFKKKRINILEKENNDPLKIKLLNKYKEAFELRKHNYVERIDFNELITKLKDILYDTNIELIIKNNQFSEKDFKRNTSHILVGAEKLNRGFTVKQLMVTYLTRDSKSNSNADTIEQRCRFFGYKRSYLKSCKVFLTEGLMHDYTKYVEHEEDLRGKLLESSDTKSIFREFVLSPTLNLTRSNILSNKANRNYLNGNWETIHNFDYSLENSRYFNILFSKNKQKAVSVKKEFINYNSKGPLRNHTALKISKKKVFEIFDNYKVEKSNIRKKQTLKNFITNIDNVDFYIIFMGQNKSMERTVVKKNKHYEIKQIHSGYDRNSKLIYPGDKQIKKNKSVCIQLYNIIAMSENDSEIHKRQLHILSVWCPENKLTSTVTIKTN